MKVYYVMIFACLTVSFLHLEVCWADTNEEAVKKAVHQNVRGETDVDDDGLNVMPVTVKKEGRTTIVSGEIRHTWRHYDPTPITYELSINEDGTASGSISVKRVKNPDGDKIRSDRNGKLSGKVGSLKCDVLTEYRAMRGAIKLIGMVVQEVNK